MIPVSLYLTEVLLRDSVICNNYGQQVWLGYNSYAWNNATFTSTTYQVQSIQNLTGSGTCVAYNIQTRQIFLDDCGKNKSYVCFSAQTSPSKQTVAVYCSK